MASVPGFNIISADGSYNFVSDVSGTYNMLRLKTGNFTIVPTPNTNIALYDLFLVAGGANGTTAGGNGGQVIDLLNNNNPFIINSSYSFLLTVGAGTQDTSSIVIPKTSPSLSVTAIGGGGVSGGTFPSGQGNTGITNSYTQLYYGGGGGAGGYSASLTGGSGG